MNNSTPTTYGEIYTTGSQYFETYPRLVEVGEVKFVVDNRNHIEVMETRTTKTGRIAAKLWNKATDRKFWTVAVLPNTECRGLNVCEGMVSNQWCID